MKTKSVILYGVSAILLVGGLVVLSFYRYATTPGAGPEVAATVWVRPGQSFSETLRQLQEAGLVQQPKMWH